MAWADPGPPPVADPQVAAPPPAQAVEPPKTEAEKLADQGRDAYRTGNYAEGYRSFERAFVLDDNSRWLYNMAKCKEKLADYKSAVRLLERYLEHHKQAHGGQAPTDAVDAEHLIRDLKQRAFEQLPEVEIKSSPVGAQVLMADGTTIGSTPVTTHMEPGNYKITLKLPNHSEVQAELVVPLAGKVSLMFGLKSKQKRAGLKFWCNVRNAQIAIDGKIMAVTPFMGQIEIEPGNHQLTLTRIGFKTAEREVTVPEDKTLVSRFVLVPTVTHASWRGWLGVPLMVIGAGLLGGGYYAKTQAETTYSGSTTHSQLGTENAYGFQQWQQLQNIGYGAGAGALALGLGLTIWDTVRDGIDENDRVGGDLLPEGSELQPFMSKEVQP